MIIDPKTHKKAVSIYNRAWTYLKEALDEIYEAGRFAFDRNDERHNLFYSDYHVRLGKNGAKAKVDLKAQKALAAKDLTTITSAGGEFATIFLVTPAHSTKDELSQSICQNIRSKISPPAFSHSV